MKNYFVFILIFIGISCSEKPNSKDSFPLPNLITFTDFPQQKKLVGTNIELDSIFYWPLDIQIYDSLFFIRDPKNKNGMWHIYNRKTQKHLHSFLKKGRGPDELLAASSFHFLGDSSMYIHDMTQTIAKEFYLDSLIKHEKLVLKQQIKFPMEEGQVIDSKLYKNQYTAQVWPDNKKTMLCTYDKSFNVQKSYAPFPELANTTDNNQSKFIINVLSPLFDLNMSTSEIMDDKLLFFFSNTDLIQCYNVKTGKNVFSLLGPVQNFPPEFLISPESNVAVPIRTNIQTYYDSYTSTDYFYLTYSGKKRERLDSYYCSSIFKFDWSGNPIAEYVLDRDITGFTVDEQENAIYALEANEVDHHLVKFRIE